jgi:hypothetical protein
MDFWAWLTGEGEAQSPLVRVMGVGDTLLPAVRCRRCNRVLKSEHSINEGIGADCAKQEAVDTKTLDMFNGIDFNRMERETCAETLRVQR